MVQKARLITTEHEHSLTKLDHDIVRAQVGLNESVQALRQESGMQQSAFEDALASLETKVKEEKVLRTQGCTECNLKEEGHQVLHNMNSALNV